MSKIQQLLNVAGEADTLSQALDEFFRDYLQSFREDEQDENATALLEQVRALGEHARAVQTTTDTPAPEQCRFPIGTFLTHVKSKKTYVVMETPVSGLRIEGTGETAYRYREARYHVHEETAVRWIRAASEMEDGRFVIE